MAKADVAAAPGVGRLSVVSTPIGNLGDITRRAVEVLSEAHCVAAEDTRRARALLSHLGIGKAHVFGYSMGARISAFLALAEPQLVATLIFGGLGSGMVDGVGDWDPIAAALVVEDPAQITHPRARMFRTFADQTKSDRAALAACIETSRELISEADAARIAQPTLIAVGTKDDIGGSPEVLAALMPNAVAFAIEGRDHMLSVGDRTFKKRALEFLKANPIAS